MIILAIAQVTLIAVELRRKRSVPAAEFPRLTGRALEVVWLVLPALLLALLVFFTWPTLGYTK